MPTSVIEYRRRRNESELAQRVHKSVRAAFSDFLARLTLIPPHRIPPRDPRPDDFSDRAEHVRHVANVVGDYLSYIAHDAAENGHGLKHGDIDAALETVSAILSDLAGDIAGSAPGRE
jgi:hypothetical protein